MADYSSTSLLDIMTDDFEVLEGSVQRGTLPIIGVSGLAFGINSSCRFTLNFDTGENELVADSIKVSDLVYRLGNSLSSRYNRDFRINLTVQYYSETEQENGDVVYGDGVYSAYEIYPYYNYFNGITTEKESPGYIQDSVINLKGIHIKRLFVDITNHTNSVIGVRNVTVNEELSTEQVAENTVNEKTPAIAEGVATDVVRRTLNNLELDSVDFTHSDKVTINYESGSITYTYLYDENNNLIGLQSGSKIIHIYI